MLKIGLTGGICSGKTTITDQFALLGIPIIDADEISRKLLSGSVISSPSSPYAPSPALLQIEEMFGPHIFDNKGCLIRSKLKHKIFSSEEATKNKKILEDIMHPLVYKQINEQIQNYSIDTSPIAYVIISIPLLVETSNHYQFDRIMVVDIDPQSQYNRCKIRDNLTTKQIEDIINTQATREQRLAVADDIIDNSQSLSNLKNTINQFHKHYLMLSRQKLSE